MNVALLHQHVPESATADERDVLTQVEAVSRALVELGHEIRVFPCTLDLGRMVEQLRDSRPDVCFNLVESLGGTDSLQALAPLVVESLGIPCTGSGGAVIIDTGRKPFAKSLMHEHGVPTPVWFDDRTIDDAQPSWFPCRFILKPALEHASLGMTDADVVHAADRDALKQLLQRKTQSFGRPCFAEAFIDGREFNLSLLARDDGGVEVLPAAEIRFIGFPDDKPRIVGSAAKWDESSFEYAATVRTFEGHDHSGPLLDEMRGLATICWRLLQLGGYARVDFRVDCEGRPWVLEVNANPCLSPDAGFAAAVQRAGLTYTEAIRRILQSALLQSRR
jgi:D-alanine-D-alanine ligase